MTGQVAAHSMTDASSLYPGEFLRCTVGSEIHGMNIGSSDQDLMGIMFEPWESHYGLSKFEQHTWRSQPEGQPSGPGDVDLTVYGLRKWMGLAVKGNPTISMLLFIPPAHRLHDSGTAADLRELAPSILSRRASGAAFLGYCEAQRQRLLGERGGRNVRPKERWDPGATYDTKYAGHMLRLVTQGVELLSTGNIELPIAEPELSYLRDVRAGVIELDEIIAKTAEREQELKSLIDEEGPLRERPDIDAVNNWLREAYWSHESWMLTNG